MGGREGGEGKGRGREEEGKSREGEGKDPHCFFDKSNPDTVADVNAL